MSTKTRPRHRADPLIKEQAMIMLKDAVAQHSNDHEALHIALDEILCHVLSEEGYALIVKEFRSIKKHYA